MHRFDCKHNNKFPLDIGQFKHCKIFEEQDGFNKLEEFVEKNETRHQELVTIIKENINEWRKQTTQFMEGKF